MRRSMDVLYFVAGMFVCLFVCFFQCTCRSCDITQELFLSNFVFFIGICIHGLWKEKEQLP